MVCHDRDGRFDAVELAQRSTGLGPRVALSIDLCALRVGENDRVTAGVVQGHRTTLAQNDDGGTTVDRGIGRRSERP